MASETLTKPPPPSQQQQPQRQQSSQPFDSQSQPSNHRLSSSLLSQGPIANPDQGARSARRPLPTSSTTVNPRASSDNSDHIASMSQPPPPPPQFSSQHSFGMSQPSSQPARPTGYHQFANSQPTNMEEDDLPQIYSVRSILSKLYQLCSQPLISPF